ncbi:hypothetical protein COCSUDRAFT_60584 [Coccomyxa subellipsoidea C-169]|uniref:Uncharacterized protein n=1 Tax=Coccomyxa subellipsoidea (strain C-169) TaxID=574566 RepID=I0YI72_COCSC|nr:hypothetical protein COCSUDRAFT_60584 [Coccomyxa subellipsoidea C-169]EIE18091.1 hypothetical protein COCSUDRAFT_60584 [Coccomyxa subellipsoidea C-169]|eukprot:XP_005642635.1 hypothetical protein COCSUDRAFT_60584 [Coccomyxa subellipsoidea C-169]
MREAEERGRHPDEMDSDPFTANATSRMSSDFRSAVSTSPLEHSLHHAGHLERACSAGMTSTVSAKRQRSTEAVGVPILDEVHPVWLEAAPGKRYLLLEDADTGDMLMPLIYMKAVFEANYSRKLSALKHRLVTMPADAVLPDSRANAYLYWRWAFEAPPGVKLLVRQELGDDNTPQGHLRLVLLPIVYNAMALKEQLRGLPLFRALQGAICASAYDCLLRHPPPDPTTPDKQADPGSGAGEAEGGMPAGSAAAPGNGAQSRLFAGPRDLAATAAKYMYNFREAEATDVSIKRPRLVHSASHDELGRGREVCHHHGAARQPAACSHATELRRELRDWKRRVETQVESIFGELAIVKNCIMQLYNVLLPGKIPPMPQPPPPPQPQQHGRAIPPLQQPPPAYRQMGARVQPRSLALSGRAPTPPLPPAEQLRSSRLPDGLVSRGVAREASHESTTSAMPCAPNLAAFAHTLPPHMPHQIAPPPESMASSGLAAAPIPAQPGSEFGQPVGHSFIMGHPAIHGCLSEGAATLALHVPQLRPAQRVPSQQHWEAMQGMASAAAQLAPQHPPFSMPTPWR